MRATFVGHMLMQKTPPLKPLLSVTSTATIKPALCSIGDLKHYWTMAMSDSQILRNDAAHIFSTQSRLLNKKIPNFSAKNSR